MRSSPRKLQLMPAGTAAEHLKSASPRLMNMLELSRMLDRDRNTIKGWVSKGCPAEQIASPDNGNEWVFDISKVVKWRESEMVRQRTNMDGMSNEESFPEGFPFAGVPDPTKRIQAVLKLHEALEKAGVVAPIEFQASVVSRAFAIVSQNVMAIPELLARELAGFPREKVNSARKLMAEKTREALKAASDHIEREFMMPET